MNFLFIHRDMPGQFGHLAALLARDPRNRVVFLTTADRRPPPGVVRALYHQPRSAAPTTHRYLQGLEDAVLRAQMAARACLGLQRRGFAPDVVVGHPGWGEPMYVKDVFPVAKFINYCEFFYHASGADAGFDPTQRPQIDCAARIRTMNAALLIALEACDLGISPTQWQWGLHPREWRSKIEIAFDGIDATLARPCDNVHLRLKDGTVLTRRQQVVTYVARDLEPYRGFPSFMRAVPTILENLPEARVLIVGGDGVSYGRARGDGLTWRQAMVDELGADLRRCYFLGTLSHRRYLQVLQLSTAHVYLTVPFVLSWSAMEALAAGCVFIGSRTPPVEEVVRDGENGVLVDFFSPQEIAAKVIDAVRQRHQLGAMRQRARETVLGHYDLTTCLDRQLGIIHGLCGRHPLPSGPTGVLPPSSTILLGGAARLPAR